MLRSLLVMPYSFALTYCNIPKKYHNIAAMREIRELTIERILNDELWEMALPHRSDILQKNECRPGYLYWGEGNREGDLAICAESDGVGSLYFLGRRPIRDKFDLFQQPHADDVSTSSGGWAPIVMLEKVPDLSSEEATVAWLLDKEIEVIETKIEWLEAMPGRLKCATDYTYILDNDRNQLDAIKKISRIGMTGIPTQPYDEMNRDRERRGLPRI